MKFQINRVLSVDARFGEPAYEIQVSDGTHMTDYTGPPYMTRSEAVQRAKAWALPDGHSLKVKHVGNGRVVFTR